MARIRTVKPEFFKHEEIYQAEIEEKLPLRLAFIGLFGVCDREGRFKWRPNQIKLDILPYDKVDFSLVLDALATRGFIEEYESEDGERFGFIPTFLDHQVINNRESESKIISPFDASVTRNPRDLILHKGKGKEGKGKERNGRDLVLLEFIDKDFDIFWNAYPRKDKKEEAKKSWNKIRPNIEVVIQALQWQKQLPGWFEKDGKFIPMASTYLNQKRWLDEQPVRVTF